MGLYILSANEIIEQFEDFLYNLEGDCPAEAVAQAWNKIAKREQWSDRLVAIDKKELKTKSPRGRMQ